MSQDGWTQPLQHDAGYANAYANHAIFWPVCGCPPMSSKCADLRRPVAGGHSRTPFGYLGVKLSLPTVSMAAASVVAGIPNSAVSSRSLFISIIGATWSS